MNGNVGQKFEYILCYSKNRKYTHSFSVEKTTTGKKYPFNNAGNSESVIEFPPHSVEFIKIKNETILPQDMSSGNIKTKLLTPVKIVDGFNENTFKLLGEWRYSQDKTIELVQNGSQITISGIPFRPNLVKKGGEVKIMHNLLTLNNYPVGSNEDATKELMKLFGENLFDFNKPSSLLKILINSYTYANKNSTVLDFFAGSSTTADAVMQLNAEDGGHRKFIMVQLPEKTYHTNSDGSEVPTKGGKAAYEAGFRSIDEISRERIRRAAAKIKADNELTLPADFDGSFKHYRVVKPNRIALERIEEFKPDTDELVLDTVTAFSSDALGVAGNASGEQTVLATWLAKDGYAFDADIQKIDLAGYQGNLVENNRLYLIRENWSSKCTEKLLNLLGTHALNLQAVVIFGYSFKLDDLRELENGLKQLDGNVSLIKRY